MSNKIMQEHTTIEKQLLGDTLPMTNGDDHALIELFDMAPVKNPKTLQCLSPYTEILKIDNIDQRFYPELGSGTVIKLLIRHKGSWPKALRFKVGSHNVSAEIVDPDDFVIRIYTTARTENSRLPKPTWKIGKVVWLFTSASPMPMTDLFKRVDLICETWIPRPNLSWDHLAAVEILKKNESSFGKELVKEGYVLTGKDLYLSH